MAIDFLSQRDPFTSRPTSPLDFTCYHFLPLCATILDRFRNLSRENWIVRKIYCGNYRDLWCVLKKTLQVAYSESINARVRTALADHHRRNVAKRLRGVPFGGIVGWCRGTPISRLAIQETPIGRFVFPR